MYSTKSNNYQKWRMGIIHLALVISATLFASNAFAQVLTPFYEFELNSVTFLDCIEWIRKDHTTGFGEKMEPPHWSPATVTNPTPVSKPVAYSSEAASKIKVKAIISLECSANATAFPLKVWVKGVGSGSNNFPYQEFNLSYSLSGFYTFEYQGSSSANLVANKVDVIDPLTITWQWTLKNPANNSAVTWTDIGTSSNAIYVTHKNPKPENDIKGYLWYHTLFKISCNAAKGESNEAQIISKIWQVVDDLKLKTAEGIELTYWKNWAPQACTAYNTKLLLSDPEKDGQCGAYAHLFLDMLKIHGIQEPETVNNKINLVPVATSGFIEPEEILINNWNIPGAAGPFGDLLSTQLGMPMFKHVNVIPTIVVGGIPYVDQAAWKANNKYNWWYSEFNDMDGAIGQNTENPKSNFINHLIAYHNGSYYDASYGKGYTELVDMEDGISAYVRYAKVTVSEGTFQLDLNGDGNITNDVQKFMVYMVAKPTGTAPFAMEEMGSSHQ
jgi:hypothetical protein